jgi:hypothetical protein
LYSFLKETAENINQEKKHLLLFYIWEDDVLIKEGVSYYLSVLDYLLFLLLDRALYEEVMDIDDILIEKNKTVAVNKQMFRFCYRFYLVDCINFTLELKRL